MTEHSQESTPTLVTEAMSRVSNLVREEFNLARAEMDENLRRALAAIGMLVAAVVIALTALNVLAGALSAALVEMGMAPGWAALTVGAAFGLIAWALMAKGTNDLKLSSLAPTRTAANLKRDANTVQGGLNDH